MTIIELLLRLAVGEQVERAEVLTLLHSNLCDRGDAWRLERVSRRKARDGALREAAGVLGADEPGAWVVAGRLQAAVVRFEGYAWPRLRAGMQLDLSPSDKALHRAFMAGERVPRTQRRLYDLLT